MQTDFGNFEYGPAFDAVDIGPLHLIQELPRVGRQRLDIPPLPLGINRIEGERRLPRPAQSGNHRQRITGYLNINVFKVMLARPAHRYLGNGHAVRESDALP